ncbi:MAG: molybdopterin-guanine dinucleotide biosynthesis protein B [Thermofilum sp.]
MKAFAVVGFKDSGKTTLAEKLVGILASRGYRVAAVKHAHSGLNLQGDSARLFAAGAERVVALSENVSEVIAGSLSLEEALAALRAYDFVVVEGFKERFPGVRVAVARSREELEKLQSPLLVAAYSAAELGGASVPIFKPGEEERLADLLTEKAFEPPAGLNCGFCGFSSCIEFARAVAKGEVSPSGCRVLASRVKLVVDGKAVELNPFVQDVVRNVVRALVSTLKGVGERPGRVELVLID